MNKGNVIKETFAIQPLSNKGGSRAVEYRVDSKNIIQIGFFATGLKDNIPFIPTTFIWFYVMQDYISRDIDVSDERDELMTVHLGDRTIIWHKKYHGFSFCMK